MRLVYVLALLSLSASSPASAQQTDVIVGTGPIGPYSPVAPPAPPPPRPGPPPSVPGQPHLERTIPSQAQLAGQTGFLSFQNPEFGFSLLYPENWVTGNEMMPNTCFKAANRDLYDFMHLTVLCDRQSDFSNRSSQDMVDLIMMPEVIKALEETYERESGASIEVKYYQRRILMGRPAFMWIHEDTIESAGNIINTESMQYIIYRDGTRFIVTLSADAGRLVEHLPLFEKVASTFTIWPTP